MTHVAFITSLTHTVRDRGAAAALAELRSTRPAFADGTYHDTLAVYYVWAVGRLIDGGLNDIAILWHPLVDPRSTLAWYPAATLRSREARDSFVPSPLALANEPQPVLPGAFVSV